METQFWTFRYADRARWGTGAWDLEPDKMQWSDPATGLPCLARRNILGSWCGYVGIPLDTPWLQTVDMDEVLEVHGGITFSGPCRDGDGEDRLCHRPAPGEATHVYWLGFDCAHAWDIQPETEANYRDLWQGPGMPQREGRVYRTLAFVQAECASLAAQLHTLLQAG